MPLTGSDLVCTRPAGRSAQTVEAYRRDLLDFARYLSADSPACVAEALLGAGAGGANRIALKYRADLIERGLSPATINRKLAALRSLVKVARTIACPISFTLDVENVKSEPYRDTRGPGVDGYRATPNALRGRKDAKGARDRAILHLLFDLGLRRCEVCSLDRAHLDLDSASVSVLGKGRRERIALTLPTPTAAALAGWLSCRGDNAGPLFVGITKGGHLGERITGRGLHKVVATTGHRGCRPDRAASWPATRGNHNGTRYDGGGRASGRQVQPSFRH